MKRFDLVYSIDLPDDSAMMWKNEDGEYVEYAEAQEKINFLVTALQSLKDCNVKLQPPEALNEFIDHTLQGFIHD